jgi:hypothetical protein
MSESGNTSKTNKTVDGLDSATTSRILKETAANIPPPSPAVFKRIEQSINELSPSTEVAASSSSLQSFFNRMYDYFNRPRLAWGVVAVQAIALCLFFAFSPTKNTYQTLSSDQTAVQSPAVPSFYVIFQDDARIQEIEHLLTQIDAVIVNGPGKRGIYSLKLLQSQSSANIDNLLLTLKKSPLITFIEKVY